MKTTTVRCNKLTDNKSKCYRHILLLADKCNGVAYGAFVWSVARQKGDINHLDGNGRIDLLFNTPPDMWRFIPILTDKSSTFKVDVEQLNKDDDGSSHRARFIIDDDCVEIDIHLSFRRDVTFDINAVTLRILSHSHLGFSNTVKDGIDLLKRIRMGKYYTTSNKTIPGFVKVNDSYNDLMTIITKYVADHGIALNWNNGCQGVLKFDHDTDYDSFINGIGIVSEYILKRMNNSIVCEGLWRPQAEMKLLRRTVVTPVNLNSGGSLTVGMNTDYKPCITTTLNILAPIGSEMKEALELHIRQLQEELNKY